MWIDLSTSEDSHQEIDADICIIGAGAAGLYLTKQLSKSDCHIVLLEAGDLKGTHAKNVGFETTFIASDYAGATKGRYFGVGGSTSHWGGVLVPHTVYDIKSDNRSVWTRIVKTVQLQSSYVLNELGYGDEADFKQHGKSWFKNSYDTLVDADISVLSTLHLPFKARNFTRFLSKKLIKNKNIQIFYHAVVNNWIMHSSEQENKKVQKISAISPNQNKLVVRAKKFIITAGAIESARILLEINLSGASQILKPEMAIGRYLSDHLSLPIAEVDLTTLKQTRTSCVPQFMGAWMRSIRFIDTTSSTSLPRAFFHFNYPNSSAGIMFIKMLLSALQARRLPLFKETSFFSGSIDLCRIAYYRLIHSELYIPQNTSIPLQMDIEQAATAENYIELSNKLDVYGRQVASINWSITKKDIENITATAAQFLLKWPGLKAGLPELKTRDICVDSHKSYDAYHPVGTCRMGRDAEAVVDFNLKVQGTENIWVVSTGVLPSAGSANPTFTMLCLAQKLADHLVTSSE